MSIVQKLVIDKELTNNLQIIIRDETGLYNPSNSGGYGGPNGNPLNKFVKYIFDIFNIYTNDSYRQIQSDTVTTGESNNPSLARIVNKENITIDRDNFDLDNFEDGIYKISMNVIISDDYTCNGNYPTDLVTNITDAAFIFNNYQAIIVGTEIYNIQDIINNNLILDRNIVSSFTSFKPVLSTNTYVIISDTLNDCLNNSIVNFSKDCNCIKDINSINILSEIQLYYWAIDKSTEANDLAQAYEYFKIAKQLACSLKCNCNG